MSSQQVPYEALLAEAKDRYFEITSKRLDDDLLLELTTVENVQKYVQKQNSSFSNFRKKQAKVFHALDATLKPVERLGSVLSSGSSLAFPPSAVCFGAAVHLVKSAKDVSTCYDKVVEDLEIVQSFTARLELHKIEMISDALRKNLATIMVRLIEVLAYSTRTVSHGRFGCYWRTVIRGTDPKVTELHEKLRFLVDEEQKLAQAEVLRRTTEIQTSTRQISDRLHDLNISAANVAQQATNGNTKLDTVRREIAIQYADIADTLSQIKDENDQKRIMQLRTRLHAILRPSTCAEDHLISIQRKSIGDIGDWISTESAYVRWLHGDFPLLWVSGDPGSGKSYLAGRIILELQEIAWKPNKGLDNMLVGYFFFRADRHKSRNFHQALRDMAAQIAQQSTPYAKHLVDQCHSAEDIDSLESAWRRLFLSTRDDQNLGKVQICLVMDGLDEADVAGMYGWNAFLEILGDLSNDDTHGPRNISLLLVGRPQLTEDVEDGYGKSVHMINMEKLQMKQGVHLFVSEKMRGLRIGSQHRAHLTESIRTTIEDKADGMILWADLVIKELKRKSNAKAMMDCVNAAPRGIHDVIGHILRTYKLTLDATEQRNLGLVLAWIYSAQRPLTLGEINDVLTFELQDGDSVFFIEQHLRGKFAGLINLTREDGLSTRGLKDIAVNRDEVREHLDADHDFESDPKTTTVRFGHASIAEYIAQHGNTLVEMPARCMEYSVMKMCLQILCNNDRAVEGLRGYAVQHWSKHLEDSLKYVHDVDSRDRDAIVVLLEQQFTDEDVIARWAVHLTERAFTQTLIQTLREWMAQCGTPSNLSSETKKWANEVKKNPGTLLLPVARFITKHSLQLLGSTNFDLLGVMRRLLSLSTRKGFDVSAEANPLSADDLLEAARWTGLEETAVWHCNVAACLLHNGCIVEAEQHYRRSLDMDKDMWQARTGLAKLCQKQGNWTESILLNSTNAEYFSDQQNMCPVDSIEHLFFRSRVSETFANLARAYEISKTNSKALQCWRKSADPRFMKLMDIEGYCKSLIIEGGDEKSKDLLIFLKALQTEGCEGKDWNCDRLTRILMASSVFGDPNYGIFYASAHAAVEHGEIRWLQDAYKEAIVTAKRKRRFGNALLLRVCLADLFSVYDEQLCEAEKIWEEAVDLAVLSENAEIPDIRICKERAARGYCVLLMKRCFKCQFQGPSCRMYLAKVEKLNLTRVDSHDPLDHEAYTPLYLGLLRRLCGLRTEARAFLQPFILGSIKMLESKDSRLRRAGLDYLGRALIAAGQNEDALQVFLMRLPEPWDDTVRDVSALSLTRENFIYSRMCHKCLSWAPTYLNTWFCKVCLCEFCEKCFERVRCATGDSPYCDKKHDWLHITADVGALNVYGFRTVLHDNEGLLSRIGTEWELQG